MARTYRVGMDVAGRRPTKALQRVVLTTVLASVSVLQSCSDPPDNPSETPIETTLFAAPQEDLDSVKYEPSFEPDYNNLTPQPWVEPATTAQQDAVDVYADRLEFPAAMTEILGWEAGRVVVGAPSQGAGKNAMGFARRVDSVALMGEKIVVMTRSVSVEEVLQGDMQLRLDPDAAQPLDLSKADLDWVANNLYFQETDPVALPGELLTDDASDDAVALGLWNSIKKLGSPIVKSVVSVAKDIFVAVTPATVGGSVNLSKKIALQDEKQLFDKSAFSKSFKTVRGLPAELSLSGSGKYAAGVEFNPGLQLGAKIALPLHNASSQFWLNVDSRFQAKLGLDLAFEAKLLSADNKKGLTLEDLLKQPLPFSEDVLGSYRDQLLGKSDTKPAGGWKKTLYVSKPMLNTFLAGPVPVVTTVTFQVDLECGFEAKADIKAKLNMEQNATFKFKVLHDRGTKKTTLEGPTFNAPRRFDVQVTGGGEVTVSCGLIPRVNAFLYDSVGLFAGVRASLVGKAGYQSECKMETRSHIPTSKVTLSLFANLGVQAGARVQAPGSSYLGSKGTVAGLEYAKEVWTKEFKLAEKEWEFSKGLGFCASVCGNQCGGSCRACQLGEECKRNSDCANSVCNKGKCSTDRCGDEVTDAQETDIDCGGPVAICAERCAVDKACDIGSDCTTGYCGARSSAKPGVCLAGHCGDGVLDGDEGGIDCGGATCAKCANGVAVSAAAACASGLWNGFVCVGAICDDGIKSGDETAADCGGPTCARRCGFSRGCMTSTDCAAGAPVCDTSFGTCLRAAGMVCTSSLQCGDGKCTAGRCTNPSVVSALWGQDSNNIWVVGESGTINKWNGAASVPQTSGTTANFRAVWGLNANNVWAAGFSGTIVKWDGTSWSPQTSGVTSALRGFWGTDVNNVWAVGDNGVIRKWNGTAWGAQTSNTMQQLVGVWGADASNIWAVGAAGTIVKWDGSAWTSQTSGTMERLVGVWGTAANSVWVVGAAGTILKWNGTAWTAQNSGTTRGLSAIAGTAANNIWAVGVEGIILKWNGTTWAVQNSGTMRYLASIWVENANRAWITDGYGTLLNWNGTAWLEK